MDHRQLRSLLSRRVHDLSQAHRHVDLPAICEQLGLPQPPLEEGMSKRDRMTASLGAAADDALVAIAQALLQQHPPLAPDRNEIEELLWMHVHLGLSTRCRRELAQSLDGSPLWLDARGFRELLDRLWVLDVEPPICRGHGLLRGEIEQHLFKNDDLSADSLFDCLGAYECTDKRFALFLEGLASPVVRPDEPDQRRFVELANTTLTRFGLHLREGEAHGGYPTFALVSITSGSPGRPKNLVFASPTKPDLRIRDAVNNDIEIVSNADDVLVYDRPINSAEGLRWRDLETWWTEIHRIQDTDEARRSLYRRLRKSLPTNSPPQARFFRSFFEAYRDAFVDLPALLPEVWLHWDPRTVKERGADALLRFRMDFLMLLPNQVRVVIEIDGQHHYSDESRRASPERYAKMVEADRELKLAGYEVYRFGASELAEPTSPCVKSFFEQLFRKYSVPVAG